MWAAAFSISLLLSINTALAFDCSNPKLPSSIVICSDPELIRLADERQQIFNETRSRVTPDQQSALWEDQKAWVRSYATTCGVLPNSTPPIPAPPSMIECFKRAAEARAAYLGTYRISGEVPTAPAIQSASASVETQGPDIDEVALVKAGGVFEIPVRINGAITLNFILDSGASDVQIPFDVFSTLVRANTIRESDLIGESTYVLADGSKKKAAKFLIRELMIGNQILHNVSGSVGPANGSLLLGQSFLSHFDSWTFDNKRHVLRLTGKTSQPSGENESPSSDNRQPGPIGSLSAPPLSRTKELSAQSAVVCGKAVEYTAMQRGGGGFLGIWTGDWNSTQRLCGALIVQEIDPQGTAVVIYVYGGSGLPWKEQHRIAVLNGNVLSFQDDQSSTFRFRLGVPGELEASFFGQSGRLSGTFQKSN